MKSALRVAGGAIFILFLIMVGRPAETTSVCFKETCFKAGIVRDETSRQLGLMFRRNLPVDQSLLFVFDRPGQHSFWMKNTLIPLDIIWLDREKRVVFIQSSALPCVSQHCPFFRPEKEALYVLEINAGQTEKGNIKVGDLAGF